MDPELLKKALEAIKNGDSEGALAVLEELIAASAAPGGDQDSVPPPPPADASQEAADMRATLAAITTLTGKKSAGEAVALISERFAKLDEIVAGQAALDASSRRELVGDLVRLGAEVPATAWEDPNVEAPVPVARLRAESVSSLRDRVAKLTAANGGRVERQQSRTAPEVDAIELSAHEKEITKGFNAAQLERYKALRASRRAS